MSDEINELIKNSLSNPKVVEGDEGKVEMRSMSELIAAAKYLQRQEQTADGGLNTIFKKIVPPGGID